MASINQKSNHDWPELSVEEINITFKVVGDLGENCKVKVVDERYLARDDAIFTCYTRYSGGQGRDKILSFLEHLLKETIRISNNLLEVIRSKTDVDNEISSLEILISGLMIFLHKYDIMRNVYKTDTGTTARFGVMKNKFGAFRQNFFRRILLNN